MQKYVQNYFEHYWIFWEYFPCLKCWATWADVHHILYKSQWGKDDVDNLIWLCRTCHDKAHFKKEPYLTAENLFKTKKLVWQ